MFVYALNGVSLPPRVGESPLFVAFSSVTPYSGYCALVCFQALALRISVDHHVTSFH